METYIFDKDIKYQRIKDMPNEGIFLNRCIDLKSISLDTELELSDNLIRSLYKPFDSVVISKASLELAHQLNRNK